MQKKFQTKENQAKEEKKADAEFKIKVKKATCNRKKKIIKEK